MELYDCPGVRLRLKARVLKAEVAETLLYWHVTWGPGNNAHYDKLCGKFTTLCSLDA